MENTKQQLIERLKTANNILVTVSADPSVDQLSAAIGLTLLLNKMGKHGTAVFSGKVPSTIDFLQPDKTIEKNTDSLRDFIIALDKSKADKLRYKVEDSHVKIFITPYRTSISDKDLEFSQGDFNVEVVVALGVVDQKDLDKAITAHGRILHDATTISMTNGVPSHLGSINWDNPDASSLGEMAASLADELQQGILDGQMATAFMTGVVAETERFSNNKTSATTMSISAALMAAGANQQLVASELQPAPEPQPATVIEPDNPAPTEPAPETESKSDDGALQIEHEPAETSSELPFVFDEPTSAEPASHSDRGYLTEEPTESITTQETSSTNPIMLEPPSRGGTLTANTVPEALDPSTDPLTAKQEDGPLLDHTDVSPFQEPADLPEPSMELPVTNDPIGLGESTDDVQTTPETPPEAEPEAVPAHEQTLTELEAAVAAVNDSFDNPTAPIEPVIVEPAAQPVEAPSETIDSARDAVLDAFNGNQDQPLPPIMALNAQEFTPTQIEPVTPITPAQFDAPQPVVEPIFTPPAFTVPDTLMPPNTPPADTTAAPSQDPAAPPTVPPPFMPGMPGFDAAPPQVNDQAPQSNLGNPFNLPPA